MTLSRFALAPLVAVACATLAPGIFLRVDIEKVPVERLAKNMKEAIEKNPKDAGAVLNLARLHAMAYSLRSDDIPVNAKQPTAPWFGYEPPIVPFRTVAKTEDKEKLKAAKAHLDEAIKLYDAALKLAPDDLRAQLGRAWLLTQTDKTDDARVALRQVLDAGWKKEKDLMALGLGGHTVTTEATGYLLPLLDKDKDKDEIAMWKERAEKIAKLPRPITPIAVPLKDGLTATDIEDRGASVAFDADGTGVRKNWTWVKPNAAWLVYDPARRGKVDSALQMFGSVSFWLFWETGYDALAALDDNRDGELRGAELTGLALWHDANGNGATDAGEVKPLSAHGIVALSTKCTRDAAHVDRIAFSKAGVTFADGRTRPTFDLVLHPARK